MNGGAGANTFMYGGGSDVITNFGEGDIVDLGGLSKITDVSKITTVSHTGGTGIGFKIDFGGNSSITFFGNSVDVSIRTNDSDSAPYVYNKDYIIVGTSATLTSNITSTFDATAFNGLSAINASVAKVGIVGNDKNNYIVGSSLSAVDINGGAGNDTIQAGTIGAAMDGGAGNDSLIGSDGADTFKFSGGNDTVDNYDATKDLFTSSNFPIIVDGTQITRDSDGNLKLTFDDDNSVTFNAVGGSSPTVKWEYSGGLSYYYSAAGISLGNSITLAAGVSAGDLESLGLDKYSTINARAVTAGLSINVGGESTYVVGSDKVLTSMFGGVAGDSLVAGSVGAFMDGGLGNDLLVGGDGKDTFVYGSGSDTIRGYDAENDIVSLSGIAPVTDVSRIRNDGGTLTIQFGSTSSLTFVSTSVVSIKGGESTTYVYKPNAIATNEDIIKLGANYGSTYNDSVTSYATIDASLVASSIDVTGNEKANSIIGGSVGGALYGGDGNDTLSYATVATTSTAVYSLDGGNGDDSLIGGNGADIFIYSGGKDRILNYTEGKDVVQLDGFKFAEATTDTESGHANNLVVTFDKDNTLTLVNIENSTISLESGNDRYLLSRQSVASNDESITLNSSYEGPYEASNPYATIDASAVNNAISITANSLGNSILATNGGTIDGGAGIDRINVEDRASDAEFTFVYDEGYGKDNVYGFDQDVDTVQIDPTKVTSAISGSKTFALKIGNSNKLTLSDGDEKIEGFKFVNDSTSGTITADGYIVGNTLNLFPSADTVDLTQDLYKSAGISAVSAEKVTDQSVKIIADSIGGVFTFNSGGSKKDMFQFGGGSATLKNYQPTYDKIYLGENITKSEVEGNNVKLTTEKGTLVVEGAKGSALSVRQASGTYKKMMFENDGIYFDKASKPTSVTISGGASSFSAVDNKYSSIKKMTIDGASGISVTAGDKVKCKLGWRRRHACWRQKR